MPERPVEEELPVTAPGRLPGRLNVRLDDLADHVGARLGPTNWRVVTQEQVDAFADVTGDHQWLHDPGRAGEGPFGMTIAHGYLTLSLVPSMLKELWRVEDMCVVLNYGLDRVRFPAPVPVGHRLRAGAMLRAVREVPGGTHATLEVTFEVERCVKPVCVADVLVRFYRTPGANA